VITRTSARWLAIGLTIVLAVLAIVRFAGATPPITTDSDFAVTELYTELATRGRLLVGPYSRFGWNHPGPFYFYLQAPLYALSGHKAASLYAGALAINLLAILTMAWVVSRENRGPLLVLLTGACVLFAWRAPRLLASPWTAHVPILPSVAFVVLSAAVVSGRLRLLPVTLIVGSFVVQTHLGFAPIVGGLSAAVLASLLLARRASDRSLWPILSASGGLLMAAWLLPIGDAVSRGGGNLAALWRFFVIEGRPGHGFREALLNWSYGIAGILRPDFALPWGGHFGMHHLWWIVPCAIGQVVVLAEVARRDLKAGRRFEGWLALSSLAASSIGLWALTRVRDDILDHEIFWLSAFGAINLAVLGAAGLRALGSTRLIPWTPGARAAATGCVLVLLLGLYAGVRDLRDLTAFELRRVERVTIVAAYEAIRNHVRAEGIRKPLIDADGPMWGHAAGVLLRLQQDGTPVAVSDTWLPMFTGAYAGTGDEDALVTIGTEGLSRARSARPGNVLLLERRSVFVDAIRITPGRSR
jgi:hypothetical protein